MNPTDYRPTTAEQFIGPARVLALTLDRIVARATPDGSPLKILIQGEPGVGKSALADYFLTGLGASKWATTKYNGTQLTLERLDDWAKTLCFRELDGSYKVLRVEEMDKASHAAQVRLLTVLDDLPPRVAIIGTSNKAVKDFEPRLASRFQVFGLGAPSAPEIETLLARWPLTEEAVKRIATFACGNVRLGLFDAQSELDSVAA